MRGPRRPSVRNGARPSLTDSAPVRSRARSATNSGRTRAVVSSRSRPGNSAGTHQWRLPSSLSGSTRSWEFPGVVEETCQRSLRSVMIERPAQGKVAHRPLTDPSLLAQLPEGGGAESREFPRFHPAPHPGPAVRCEASVRSPPEEEPGPFVDEEGDRVEGEGVGRHEDIIASPSGSPDRRARSDPSFCLPCPGCRSDLPLT